ncbi:MAG TPA: hypothetical protein VGN72_00485 [Tepidisphaeraceae bacterium]|jgi:hypothetical protein|nr:hypothetical protein [Tepidisphaeraceae bacterium]
MLRHASLILLSIATLANGAGPKRWTQTSEADFRSGTFDNVVATNLGDLKLSRATKTLLEQDPRVSTVYALAQLPDGTIYAGTGPQGVLLRISEDKVDTAATIEGSIGIFSLAVDGEGRLLLGTGGEAGKVLRINKAGEAPIEVFASPLVKYVWAIQVGADGTIYAATGPNGQLIAIAPDGTSRVLFDSIESNLLSLAYDGKQTLFAGSDPNGVVYRIDAASGKAFVLYDANETEISALALDAAGTLYAGTAQPVEGATDSEAIAEQTGRPEETTSGPPIVAAPAGDPAPPDPNPGRPEPEPRQDAPDDAPAAPEKAEGEADKAADADVETDAMSEIVGNTEPAAEGNAIYRIDSSGFVTEIFRRSAMVMSLLEDDGTLLVGTGSEGFVYQIRPTAEESVVIAKLDPKQVMAMLRAKDGRVFLGLANAGGIAAMSPGFANSGTYTSEVFDASQVSQFGAIQMHGNVPANAKVTLATRSGNLQDANSPHGWSDWSAEQPANAFVNAATPPGRFLQYRLTFTSTDGQSTPAVTDVQATYQVPNLPPAIKSITVETAVEEEAATDDTKAEPAPTRMRTVAWEATDANDDAIAYTLAYRTTGTEPWIVLKEDLKEATFQWDTKRVADGRYELRVTATDATANPAGTGRQSSRVSDPVLVDNTAPLFDAANAAMDGQSVKVDLKVTDKTGTIASIEYAVDSSQDWQAVAASDSIYDSPSEAATFSVASLSAGPHQIAVRATDSNGNQGIAHLQVTIPEKQ